MFHSRLRFSHDRDYSPASLRLGHHLSSRGADVLDRKHGNPVDLSVLHKPLRFSIGGRRQGSDVGCSLEQSTSLSRFDSNAHR